MQFWTSWFAIAARLRLSAVGFGEREIAGADVGVDLGGCLGRGLGARGGCGTPQVRAGDKIGAASDSRAEVHVRL